MNTLQNKIGLRPISEGSSREYIDDLTNVDYNLLAAIASDAEKIEDGGDGVTFLFGKVLNEQYKCFKADVLAEFAKRANFQEVADRTRPPSVQTLPKLITTTADQWHGVGVLLPTSRYQSVFIHSVFSRVTLADTIARIYTLSGGQVGEDIPISLTKGGATLIALDFPLDTYQCEQLVIAVKIPSGTVLESFYYQHCTQFTVSKPIVFADGSTPNFTDSTVSLSYTYVSTDYELRIGIDRVIDHFADRLARPFALLCGADIMKRALNSQKASVKTLINRPGMMDNYDMLKADQGKELAGALRSIYKEVEKERLALVANPDDQPGYYVADAF